MGFPRKITLKGKKKDKCRPRVNATILFSAVLIVLAAIFMPVRLHADKSAPITPEPFSVSIPSLKSDGKLWNVHVDNKGPSIIVNGTPISISGDPTQKGNRLGIGIIDGLIVNYQRETRRLCAVITWPIVWYHQVRNALFLDCYCIDECGDGFAWEIYDRIPLGITIDSPHLIDASAFDGSAYTIREIAIALRGEPDFSGGRFQYDLTKPNLQCLKQLPLPQRRSARLEGNPLAVKVFTDAGVIVVLTGQVNNKIVDVHGYDFECNRVWTIKQLEFQDIIYSGEVRTYSPFNIMQRNKLWSEPKWPVNGIAARLHAKWESIDLPQYRLGQNEPIRHPIRVQPQQSTPNDLSPPATPTKPTE